MKCRRMLGVSAVFALAIIAGVVWGEAPADPPATNPAAAGELPTINLRRTVTVDVVRRTKDAVVCISATKLVNQRMSPFGGMFPDMEFGPVVRVPTSNLGSGFIIHPDGYVVTNNHVIARARQIRVEFADGRKLDAELISSDAEADLAILKVKSDTPLPALDLGDSKDLMIGEPVIAVGNPLGFSHSVSTGIVSAEHRDLSGGPGDKIVLRDLIQTDAAINPGNSGGPLLNAYGQVIGINTAIRGDAQNIGFAIQANKLRDMIPALLNPAQAAKLDIPVTLAEKRTITEPCIVNSQVQWCEENDKRIPIAEVNGRKPKDIIDAYAILLACKPGDVIGFKFADGSERKVEVKPAALPEVVTTIKRRLGIVVQELTPMLAEKSRLAVDEGILVTEVVTGSIAQRAGLQVGDVIVQVGVPVRQRGYSLLYPVTSLDKFGILVQRLPRAGVIQLGVHRGRESGTIDLDLASAPRRESI